MVIHPLGTNSVLQEAALKRESGSALARVANFNDTLILPFEDDFSRPGVYPFDSLWIDSNVYINTDFSTIPVTIGMATFDGLNKNGVPYNIIANRDTVADFLTSRPIDLGQFVGDTTIWLSFFYQPQGLGDRPEGIDSLVLQFKDTAGSWVNMWSVPGRTDTAFQRVNIRVSDPVYQYKGFQFRFYNIATVNGNRDHWHLDYVILRRFTAANDSILDNAMIAPLKTLLGEYTSMPYTHYKSLSNPSAAMISSITDSIYNINYGGTSYLPQISIENNGTILLNNNIGSISTFSSLTYTDYTIPLNGFSYPVLPDDSAEFVYKSYFNFLGAQSNRNNDTSYCYQKFHNYYSYDDGTAELAFSLSGNAGISLAYQFDVKKIDTLRGVQIYFNPVGENVTNRLFQLTAWSNVDPNANTATELYRMINVRPGDPAGINGYKTFLFDVPLAVGPGTTAGPTLWVGFIQNDPQILYGVGLDRNTDSRSKAFYRVDGQWYQSNIKGSLMIRPVFGDRIPVVGIEDTPLPVLAFSIGPNPASESISLFFEANVHKHLARITDITGAIVHEQMAEPGNNIDISSFAAGIYFIRLTDLITGKTGIQKLIVH